MIYLDYHTFKQIYYSILVITYKVVQSFQVKAEYSIDKAQEISKIWQSALHNNHIQAER